jgi:hypothetical protein
MLTRLDETLLHQTPRTFGEVYTSDHRFFDRCWFCAYDPEGSIGLITGMGSYANMNVMDGFAAVQCGGKQYNLRVSRTLRPAVDDPSCGPLRHEVVEPLQELRLVLEPGDYPIAFDLRWLGFLAAHEEAPHLTELDGRTVEDYRRFDQIGQVDGWIEVEGQRHEARHWFGARDHSWGVRRGVGGFEPFTGTLPPEARGLLFGWLAWATEEGGGQVQFRENGEGERQYLDGRLARPPSEGRAEDRVCGLDHEIRFIEGTRAYERAELCVQTEGGAKIEIEARPLLTAWAYVGTGYDHGFADGKGLGAYRGELLLESDVYDVSHPEDVVRPDGQVLRPVHREQPVRLLVDGKPGTGHFPIMTVGRVARYGLGT